MAMDGEAAKRIAEQEKNSQSRSVKRRRRRFVPFY
jgi:hypothetical protein